jgi:hypothetical protein
MTFVGLASSKLSAFSFILYPFSLPDFVIPARTTLSGWQAGFILFFTSAFKP